jgi:hypothetical protein
MRLRHKRKANGGAKSRRIAIAVPNLLGKMKKEKR